MGRKQQAILLDWDGVVSDSLGIYVDFYRTVSRRYQKPLPVSTLEEFREWYDPNWEKNFHEMGFTSAQYLDILELANELLDYAQAPMFPDIPKTIWSLAGEWPLAIVSTCPAALIRQRLEQEKLDGCFDQIVGSEDGSTEKVERISHTLGALNLKTGVMVGDTCLDIQAGQANRLKTVGVTYGWITRRRVAAAGPTTMVHHPHRLEAAIRDVLAS